MSPALTLPLVGLLISLPGIPGFNKLPKLRHEKAAVDTLPPVWKPHSALALENQFVLPTLPPIGPKGVRLKVSNDPRRLQVDVDSDSGTVTAVPELGEVELTQGARVPMEEYHRQLMKQSFRRIWADRSRQSVNAVTGASDIGNRPGGGYQFNLPVHLPSFYHGILGPGGPAINVSGSENVKLSGTSEWSNQQTGLIGQRRSLFPSLDMEQDLDIRLEGQLSDRVKVNLLQNSATQIPLANKIAINYKGDEDDLVQALDLGNTNLSLPGTQYVSYSGKNEGLFGMKATTRLGPLDFTLLASKQEGRSERAGYHGGASRQSQLLADKDYIRGVYYFLYDPNTSARVIEDASINLYIDDGSYANATDYGFGRGFLDPTNVSPDTTVSRFYRGVFHKLRPGKDLDFEIMSDYYGPLYKIIRLRAPLSGENQALAVTYRYRKPDPHGNATGDSLHVGGETDLDTDGTPRTRMMLLRAPADLLPVISDPLSPFNGFYDDTAYFAPVRDLELKNFYPLNGQNIDQKTFQMAIRQGDDQPPVTTSKDGVPYLEVLGLDNLNETGGGQVTQGHDGLVDGLAATSTQRGFIDLERGILFFPDLRPFSPRIENDATGREFERKVSHLLFRSDSLVGTPPARNQANVAIYDKKVVQSFDGTYRMDIQFTASTQGSEIMLGRTNIIDGSEVVTVNGTQWAKDRDYRIDYDLGRVNLIKQLPIGAQLNIDYSYAPLFQQAGSTLLGNAFRWEGRDKSFGGAFMYESKGAQDARPRIGEEPSRMVIGDLNTEWKFKPNFLTRAVDFLPGVRTTAPSELNILAEVGGSQPNPNTQNEVFLDDMEGVRDAVSLSLSPERWHWTSIPQRGKLESETIDNPSVSDPQKNSEIHWYAPLNVVHERDLKPTLTDAQGAQNSRQVLALSLPRRPASEPASQPLWAGLTYALDPSGIDLSRSQFIEVWVNDFRDRHNGVPEDRVRGNHVKLHIDLGQVSEDQQRAPNIPPNHHLDTEDRVYDGKLQVTDVLNEDTGLDSLTSEGERARPPNPVPDLITQSGSDPAGDDFQQPNTDFKDWDPRKWRFTNGTEDNKNIAPFPETEDLINGDNRLQTDQSYFEYTIDLGDTAQRYLVTDVYETYSPGGTGHYTNNEDVIPSDNGWRRYRIPIADSLKAQFGSPNLIAARSVRLWIEDVLNTDPPPLAADDARPFMVIGGVDIVGSRWQAANLDPGTIDAGTTLTLNTVNSVDNADIYAPPFDPGEARNGNQEVTRREQSLALEFTHLAGVDTLEAFKTFSLDEDYSRYSVLDFYAAGFDISGYTSADTIDYFVRFSSDEKGLSYYEYRARIPSSSAPKAIDWHRVSLVLTELSNLKLRKDFPTTQDVLYQTPGKALGETYVIKGHPSFTRLRRISFGLINLSGKPYPRGQVWLDELRGTGIAKDFGRAQRVQVIGRVANLLSFSSGWDGRDENFQSVGESRGSGNTIDNLSLQTGIELHRFFESSRILLPVNYAYARSSTQPRFTAGDDVVRSGAVAEASDSRSETRNLSASYSRAWSDRTNPFIKYTAGGFTANINHVETNSRNPVSIDQLRSTQAQVNYSISPRSLARIPIPSTKISFFPLPERFFWNYSVINTHTESFQRLLDSNGVRVPLRSSDGRPTGVQFGADTRPFDFFHHSFVANRNLSLPAPLLEKWGPINFGRVVNWGQNMDARVQTGKYGPWLSPSLSWTGRYQQNNGPELSPDLNVRSIGNNQTISL